MREIKFRGKPIEDYGKITWFYGNAVLDYENKLAYIEASGQGFVPVEWESVGQYTEVHDDEEDNEVYNGDIVEITHEERLLRCFVKYEGSGFMLVSDELEDRYIWMSDLIECDRSYFWLPDSIVIGNIYENPELLGETQ
nr:YopX family protein [Brevibacillus laterosporus]